MERGIVRVDIGKIFGKIAIIIAFFYPMTCSIYAALTKNAIKVPYTFVLSCAFILLSALISRKRVAFNNFQIALSVGIIIIILNMIFIGGQMDFELAQMVLLLFFVVFLSQDDYWFSFALSVIEIVGLFYATTVFFQAFFPNQFEAIAKQYLPESRLDVFFMFARGGIFSGLTSQVSIVGCYIVSGLFVRMAKVIAKREDSIRVHIFEWVEIVYFSASILLIGKRAHLIFSILTVIAFLLIKNSNSRIRKHSGIILALFILVLATLIIVPMLPTSDSKFLVTLKRIFTADTEDVSNGRMLYYGKTMNLIIDHPFLGVGWKNAQKNIGANCHNIYLQLIAETGILAGVFLIGLLVTTFLKSKKLLERVSEIELSGRVPLYFSVLFLIFFLIYGMTGNPLYDTEYLAMLTVTISVIVYYTRKR